MSGEYSHQDTDPFCRLAASNLLLPGPTHYDPQGSIEPSYRGHNAIALKQNADDVVRILLFSH